MTPLTPTKRRRRRPMDVDTAPSPIVYAFLTLAVAASLAPIVYTVLIASNDRSATTMGNFPFWPGNQLLDNAREVVETIPFWSALANSLLISTTVALSVVLFSTLAGYAFAKLRFRGNTGLLLFVIATMAVPTQLGVIPLFMLMSDYGLIGSPWAVILPALVNAFGVFWMTQYLRDAVPFELIEAARLDGASSIRTFWHVALPAARPAASMLGLFTFVFTWTNYFWPMIALGAQNQTLTVALTQLQAARAVDNSLVLAGVLLASLPLIILLVVAGKQLVAGIMAGAVKG